MSLIECLRNWLEMGQTFFFFFVRDLVLGKGVLCHHCMLSVPLVLLGN